MVAATVDSGIAVNGVALLLPFATVAHCVAASAGGRVVVDAEVADVVCSRHVLCSCLWQLLPLLFGFAVVGVASCLFLCW